MLRHDALNAVSLNGSATPAVLLSALACGASTSAQGVGTPTRGASSRAASRASVSAQTVVTRAFALPADATLPQAKSRLRASPTHIKAARAAAASRGRLIGIQYRYQFVTASATARSFSDGLPNALLGSSVAQASASALIARPDRRVFTTARAPTTGLVAAQGSARLDLRAAALAAGGAFAEPSIQPSGASAWIHSAALRVSAHSQTPGVVPQFLARAALAGRTQALAAANLRHPAALSAQSTGRIAFSDQVLLIPPGGLWRSIGSVGAAAHTVKLGSASPIASARLRVRSEAHILGWMSAAARAALAPRPTRLVSATVQPPTPCGLVHAEATRLLSTEVWAEGFSGIAPSLGAGRFRGDAAGTSSAQCGSDEWRVTPTSATALLQSQSTLASPLLSATGHALGAAHGALAATVTIVHHELARATAGSALGMAAEALRTCVAVGLERASAACSAAPVFLGGATAPAQSEEWFSGTRVVEAPAAAAGSSAAVAAATRVTFADTAIEYEAVLTVPPSSPLNGWALNGQGLIGPSRRQPAAAAKVIVEVDRIATIGLTSPARSALVVAEPVFVAPETLAQAVAQCAGEARRVAFPTPSLALLLSGVVVDATLLADGAGAAVTSLTAASIEIDRTVYGEIAAENIATLAAQEPVFLSGAVCGGSSLCVGEATRIAFAAAATTIGGDLQAVGTREAVVDTVATALASGCAAEVDRTAYGAWSGVTQTIFALQEPVFLSASGALGSSTVAETVTRIVPSSASASGASACAAVATRVLLADTSGDYRPVSAPSTLNGGAFNSGGFVGSAQRQTTASALFAASVDRRALIGLTTPAKATLQAAEPTFEGHLAWVFCHAELTVDPTCVFSYAALLQAQSTASADATRIVLPTETAVVSAQCQAQATRITDSTLLGSGTMTARPVPAETRIGSMTLRLVASSAQARGVISQGLLDPEQRTFYRPATQTEFKRPGTLALRRAA